MGFTACGGFSFFGGQKIMDTFCSDDIKELAGAMLKGQSEINPAIKDASNPFAKSRYATLNSVINASREALLTHGVWVVQYPVPVEQGHLGLITRLIHASSGQWLSCLLVMPLSKVDPQGYGSALTYARRYSLASMVGLITEDDDAESARGRQGKQVSVRDRRKADPVGHVDDNPTQPDTGHDAITDNDNSNQLVIYPRLEGINYQEVVAHDGQICVVATGDTVRQKDNLKNNGFKWNPNRKIWWRYAEAA
jgi:hypothetical protein